MSILVFFNFFPLTEAALPFIPTITPATNLGFLLVSPLISILRILLSFNASREVQYSVGLGTATFIFLLSLLVSGA